MSVHGRFNTVQSTFATLLGSILIMLGTTRSVVAQVEQPSQAPRTTPIVSLLDRCNSEIARQTAPLIKAYARDVQSLQREYQKQGELHALLATKAEVQRVEREQTLTGKNLTSDPPGLATLQRDYLTRVNTVRFKVLADVVAKSESQVRSLTRGGRLDDATQLDKETQEVRNARDASRLPREITKDSILLNAPSPQYPYEARARRITGSGVCLIKFDPRTGFCVDAEMMQSTGNNLLDQAALNAFRKWRVKPGTTTELRRPINFTVAGANY